MATAIELYRSREGVESLDDPSAVLIYLITGTNDDATVRTTIEAAAPATYLGLEIHDYDFRPLGNQLWEAAVHYGLRKITGQSSYSFDTGGGTSHITQSKATVASYPAGSANFQGAIGVSGDAVDGCDITVPVYNFQETHYLNAAYVDSAYKATLFSLTGKVNAATFKGFAAGEVLFLGASGAQRGLDDWEITFKFAASPNATGLAVGGITGISKGGWNHLWVLYADDVNANTLIKRPVAAYVERVYDAGNFTLLGI